MLLNSALLWRLSTLLLFGNLRLIEYEHILERLPFTLINTILMTSMFKEQDFSTVMLFGFLLIYVKVFHWILRDRLDGLLQNMQETTRIYKLILSRFTLNMVILFIIDLQMVCYCINTSLLSNFSSSTSVVLMIGMEFSMLLIDLSNMLLHSSLNLYEFYRSQQSDNIVNLESSSDGEDEADNEDEDENQFTGLEGKFLYERIIDIFTRFLKTIVHCLMLIPLKIPVMLMKDIVWDLITLYQNITMVWKTWRNNRQLDDKLPTVSEESLKAMGVDNICIICMDELIPEQRSHRRISKKYTPKRLPCGHVLHLCCLKNWMERSQTCPICRLPVFDESGNVLPSHISSPTSASSVPTDSNTDVPMEQMPQPTTSTGLGEDNGEIEEVCVSQERKSHTARNTWYPFSIEGSSENSISFTLNDIKKSREVPVKLMIDRSLQNNSNEVDNDTKSELIKRVVIPDEYIFHNSNIDSLKRRISELESQVQDLNKRIRKD